MRAEPVEVLIQNPDVHICCCIKKKFFPESYGIKLLSFTAKIFNQMMNSIRGAIINGFQTNQIQDSLLTICSLNFLHLFRTSLLVIGNIKMLRKENATYTVYQECQPGCEVLM